MLYGDENDLDRKEREDNIYVLYKRFVNAGGFGKINLHNLTGIYIKKNDIVSQIRQENDLIQLYELVFNCNISDKLLEKKYLGRKRLNIYQRMKLHICSDNNLPKSYENTNKSIDKYKHFMMNNTIHGYLNRVYWSEWSNMKL